mgnify:CR=1 FL=1
MMPSLTSRPLATGAVNARRHAHDDVHRFAFHAVRIIVCVRYAGGVGLASVCDVLVAVPEVNFCLSEARLGLLPATISPYVIRAMGAQAARRYMVTAERFSVAQAHAMGMVHELVSPDALDAKVAEIVNTLVANGPAAVRACKQLVLDVAGRPIDAALREDTARRIADIRAAVRPPVVANGDIDSPQKAKKVLIATVVATQIGSTIRRFR